MTSLLLTDMVYKFKNDEQANQLFRVTHREAVVTLGKGDSFREGIKKFIRHHIPSSNWMNREESERSITIHEPEPYKGTFNVYIIINDNLAFNVSGNFRLIGCLIL